MLSALKVLDGNNATTLADEDVRLYLESITDEQLASTEGTSVLAPKQFTAEQDEDDGEATALGMPATEMVLAKKTVSTTGTDHYRLRMWLASTYGDDDGNTAFEEAKKFTVKINVYAKAV